MASRYFFALCAVAMFAAVASASVEKAPTNELFFSDYKNKIDDSQLQAIPERAIVDEIVKVLQEVCSVAKNCLKDVIAGCKIHWLNPRQFLQCVKQYIKDNEEKCLNQGFASFY